MSYTIHQLATLSGVSVRTLHYYDEIGLLVPVRQSDNGYRVYTEAEAVQLQQILFFRELDFSLEDIKRIINSPDYTILEALKAQKKMLLLKQARLAKLVRTVTHTITSMTKQQSIKDEELYNAFDDADVKQYQAEVKQRWGTTDAYRQSQQKVSKMTKQEMDELKRKTEQLTAAIAEAMDKGPGHVEVQALIAKHYEGINFFYACDLVMYKNLAAMYVNDPRFKAYYEKFRIGLAHFMFEAMEWFVDHARAKMK